MNLYSLILDNFFDSPEQVRESLISSPHQGIVSPYDNVFYPDLNGNISSGIKRELIDKIKDILKSDIKMNVCFSRLSLEGSACPHQVHTDKIMGEYTALVYMNRPEDCRGGTSIHKHKKGWERHPSTKEGEDQAQRDTNSPDCWEAVSNCSMKFNRLFLIDSELFHRSEPVGGFGETIEDGRLVLIAFLNRL